MSKGAFTYNGTKKMSGSRGVLTRAQGKMSGSHGTNGQSKNNNMSHNTGGDRVGSNCRTFRHDGIKQHSGVPNDTKHAKQPKGSGE